MYPKDVLTHNLCNFTAILLVDKVLTLPKFAKKLVIIQVIVLVKTEHIYLKNKIVNQSFQ